jgi:uncharacterized protein (TIGR03643 family)
LKILQVYFKECGNENLSGAVVDCLGSNRHGGSERRTLADVAAFDMSNHEDLDAASISEVIQMALSDHVSFAQIRATHGLSPDHVKALMRQNLSPGSYRAWRRRVRRFGDQRQRYK